MSLYPYPVGLLTPPAPSGPAAPANSTLWLTTRASGRLWSDIARMTPAANLGAVASWHDPISTRSVTQSIASQRPIRTGSGPAVEFDGLDDRLDVGDAADLRIGAGWAVELWVRPLRLSNIQVLACKDRGGDAGGVAREWTIYLSGARVEGAAFSGGGAVSAAEASTLTLNTWAHVVATYTPAAGLALIVNGVAGTTTSNSSPVVVTTAPLTIATRGDGVLHNQAQIDELTVYQFGGSVPAVSHWSARHSAGLALRS